MLKALFITHDTSNYGASQSLQLLLRNYGGASVDLVVQRPLLGRHDQADLRRRFGGNVNAIHDLFLPFDPCYQYRRNGAVYHALLALYNRLFWGLSRSRIREIIGSGHYDFIHLNSLVLHPIIAAEHPFILHMRDVYDGSSPAAVESVKKAAGVVFIDEATRAPFLDVPLRNSIVLNNPFDMTGAARYAGYRPDLPAIDVRKNTIFSMIGVASENKGTEFVLRAFMACPAPEARLLIVGGREEQHLKHCRDISHHDPRVIFWGEEPDINKVYAISDYILRGESFQCIGRTIYEGLYAGCSVIIPADPDDVKPLFEYDTFRDHVFLYRPRDSAELTALIGSRAGRKVQDRTYRSNVQEYVRAFDHFVNDALAAVHP